MNIKLTEAQKIKILNSDDVFEIMQKVLNRENKIDQDKEHFWIIGLAVNLKILFVELVSIGGVRSTVVEPMNVFRVAILKNAVSVILVHNHPSGELKPSSKDKDITDNLIQVGKIIRVQVDDHLIISRKSFLSFLDIGLFEELEKSLKYVPPYQIVEMIRKEEQKIRKEALKEEQKIRKEALKEEKRIRKEAVKTAQSKGEKKGEKKGKEEGIQIGEERGEKNKALEMAKSLKQQGIETPVIVKASGLSVKEIEKL